MSDQTVNVLTVVCGEDHPFTLKLSLIYNGAELGEVHASVFDQVGFVEMVKDHPQFGLLPWGE